MVVNGAIGMFTPPFGLNLFVATGVSKEPVSKIISGIVPFCNIIFNYHGYCDICTQVTMFLLIP